MRIDIKAIESICSVELDRESVNGHSRVDVNAKSMFGAELLRSWPDDLGYSITPDFDIHSADSPYCCFSLLLLALPSFP